jgi:uncharacterized DUF497 family protein
VARHAPHLESSTGARESCRHLPACQPDQNSLARRPDDKRHTLSYPVQVKTFRWSPDKNEALQAERGVSFERVVVAIGSGGLLDILAHTNSAQYPRQRLFVVAFDGYAYLVPFVEEADYFFLKTIIPSRKATRDYLKKGKGHA